MTEISFTPEQAREIQRIEERVVSADDAVAAAGLAELDAYLAEIGVPEELGDGWYGAYQAVILDPGFASA